MSDIVIGFLGGIVIYAMGISMGYWIWGRDRVSKPKKPDPEESNEILVRRVRPSFRHPGKTSMASYDSYKQSNGLYAPVRQGRGSTADEVDKK